MQPISSPLLALPLRTALAPPRLAALAGALLLYGLFSAPAPPGIGTAELAIALAGLFAVGLSRPILFACGQRLTAPDRQEALGALALVLLLWPPLLVGALRGWDPADILRDVVPLGFLFLPLLLRDTLDRAPDRMLDLLAHALAAAGVAFALRWWVESGGSIRGIGRAAHGDGDLYLLNSASVTFATVWLVVKGAPLLATGARNTALGAVALAGAFVCLGAMTAAVNRGALLLTGTALLIGGLRWAASRPGRLLAVAGALGAAVLLWGSSMDGAVMLLLAKTDSVGVNMRGEEFGAVLRQVTSSPLGPLLGEGWGALLVNPAVGGWQVSYVHSAAGYVLLKAGALGVCALLLYLGALAPTLRRAAALRPDLALACLPPLASGLLVHTSYKYLCFGVCLSLLVMAGRRGMQPSG